MHIATFGEDGSVVKARAVNLAHLQVQVQPSKTTFEIVTFAQLSKNGSRSIYKFRGVNLKSGGYHTDLHRKPPQSQIAKEN